MRKSYIYFEISSVQFSRSVVSDSLWPYELQHTRPPCPSPTPRAYSNSCPLHWWCHPTISSSDAFSFCPQSLPAPGTFSMHWLFTSGDQNTGASASASVLPMSIQGWFPLRLTGWISLLSKGRVSQESPPKPQFKAPILQHSAFFIVQLSHLYMTTGKTTNWLTDLCWQSNVSAF